MRARGTLTSPHFEIAAGHISFLIGGGSHAETRVDLRVDGKIVRTAKGRERERLAWKAWDVRDLRGKTADIQVVDRRSERLGAHQPRPRDSSRRAGPPGGRIGTSGPSYGADFLRRRVVERRRLRPMAGSVWLGWMSNWEYANEVPTSPWQQCHVDSSGTAARPIRRRIPPCGRCSGCRAEITARRGSPIQRRHGGPGQCLDSRFWPDVQPTGNRRRVRPQLELQGVKLFVGKTRPRLWASIASAARLISIGPKQARTSSIPGSPVFNRRRWRPADKPVKLRLFVDSCSVEGFVNDGEQVLTA